MDTQGRVTKLTRHKKINMLSRSCHTCRQRKVRCTYNRGDQPCVPCSSRGLSCTAQENAEPPTSNLEPKQSTRSTEDRLQTVEDLLEKLLERIEERSDFSPKKICRHNDFIQLNQSAQVPALKEGQNSLPSPLDSERTSSPDHVESNTSAPIFSLFDNAILKTGRTVPAIESRLSPPKSSTPGLHESLILLRDKIPSPRTLSYIVSSSKISLEFWIEMLPDIQLSSRYAPKEHKNRAICETLRLWLDSDDVGLVVKATLCLALCTQQLPEGCEWDGPSLTSNSEEQWVKIIDSILLSDESLLYTINGIECLVLEANFYVNLGKPQRAWLLLQRALNHSHLRGLHRLDIASTRVTGIWTKAWIWEKQLSLMLGIPSSSLNKVPIIEKALVRADIPHEQRLWLEISEIGGKLADRNRDTLATNFNDITQLEQDLEICRASFPSDWWDGLIDPEPSYSAVVESTFLARIMYWNVRKLAHLPLMVRALTDDRYEYNRKATLDSSREMLKLFQSLHDSTEIRTEICNVLDFQIFTAAMVLVVNVLASNPPNRNDADLEAIRQIASLFGRISTRRNCIVAAQSSKVLQDFITICNDEESESGDVYEVGIPYFGRIRVSCQSKRKMGSPDQFNMMGLYGNEFEFSDIFLTSDICDTDWAMNNELDLESNWAWLEQN